ncbi:MAG: phosphotransferase [Rickettsiales bacterium]|jgi:aminoglycoside phosphotransferase (APT) family kinase protein|nr:phosphotransferase [Rickettsiales bacterium]
MYCVLNYISSRDYEDYFRDKTEGDKEKIIDEFVNFIKEMHSIPIKVFSGCLKSNVLYARNLAFYKYKLEINNFNIDYDTLLPILKRYDLSDDFNKSIQIFSNFDWNDNENVVCHNDLHRGNIMIDDGNMNGIIDFGDCIYTNYNVEFISIFKWQEGITIKIAKKYEEIMNKKLDIEFIFSVIKLGIYAKITSKLENLEKYLEKLYYYGNLSNLLLK